MRDLQKRILSWARQTFGTTADDPKERAMRFLEEAIELSQACGISRSQAYLLLDHVYTRPIGTIDNEITGTVTTLLALGEAMNIDVMETAVSGFAIVEARPLNYYQRKHRITPFTPYGVNENIA